MTTHSPSMTCVAWRLNSANDLGLRICPTGEWTRECPQNERW